MRRGAGATNPTVLRVVALTAPPFSRARSSLSLRSSPPRRAMVVAGAASRCVDACMGWLFYLRLALQLVWLRVNRALWQTRAVRPGKLWTRHKIVVLGDGFAEGFGDWVTCGTVAGLATKLTTALGQTATSVRGVLHNWTVLNVGHLGSSSVEWRPTHPRPPAVFGGRLCCRCSRAPLWRQLESDAALAEAEIVVVVVGSGDFRRSDDFANIASTTVDAIKAIALACKARGQLVYIVGLAPSGPASTPESMHNQARNRLLRAFVREEERLAAASAEALAAGAAAGGASASAETRASAGSGADSARAGLTSAHRAESLIRWGASLSDPRFRRRELHSGGGDAVHLNSAGFKVLAAELAQSMMRGVKRIEWLASARALKEGGDRARAQLERRGPW